MPLACFKRASQSSDLTQSRKVAKLQGIVVRTQGSTVKLKCPILKHTLDNRTPGALAPIGLRRGTEVYDADFTIREVEAKCKFRKALSMAVAKSFFDPHPLPLSRLRERGDSAAVCVRLPLARLRERRLGGEGWRGNRTLQPP